MSDTSRKMEHIVTERYRQMSPHQRMQIASSMFETARAIVESSLPPDLSRRERRLAFARRMYGDELPESALQAYADWPPALHVVHHSPIDPGSAPEMTRLMARTYLRP